MAVGEYVEKNPDRGRLSVAANKEGEGTIVLYDGHNFDLSDLDSKLNKVNITSYELARRSMDSNGRLQMFEIFDNKDEKKLIGYAFLDKDHAANCQNLSPEGILPKTLFCQVDDKESIEGGSNNATGDQGGSQGEDKGGNEGA